MRKNFNKEGGACRVPSFAELRNAKALGDVYSGHDWVLIRKSKLFVSGSLFVLHCKYCEARIVAIFESHAYNKKLSSAR